MICTACKKEKDVAEFPTRCDRNIPLKTCTQCTAAADAQRRKDAEEAAQGLRTCVDCRATKPIEEFSARQGYGRGPSATHRKCKACVNAYGLRYYLATKDREEKRAAEGHAALLASGAVTRGCARCKRQLALVQFARDRRSHDGFKRTCRECDSAPREDRRALDPHAKNRSLKRYGINAVIYELLSEAQNHACRVCGEPRSALKDKYGFHVDHDHDTGKVRGLLCRGCNVALGSAKDDPRILRGLLRYLSLDELPPTSAPLDEWRQALSARQDRAPLAE